MKKLNRGFKIKDKVNLQINGFIISESVIGEYFAVNSIGGNIVLFYSENGDVSMEYYGFEEIKEIPLGKTEDINDVIKLKDVLKKIVNI